ncbi:hypothetical protein PR202_gb11314 [Eleusine coracana subsp. coracana]|uniref:ABC1 atypical kinase-like domain-containing protein n=1 Tax=Eleusine coracana subsp. coracana TaxID=191504 RepID=A0AAV5EKA7_ELECO|nr:hypothetical protein PR202_gb11314 [Eleusine coracana subsp. coracana]
MWRRAATAALSLGAGAGAVSIASSEDPAATLKVCAHLPPRLLRDSVTAATIAADYSWSLWGLEPGTPAYLAAKHDAHLRSANRLQELCFRNGGIYIKLGQHIAQLEYVVPVEYVQTMRESMLKRCPVSSIEQVRGVFAKDLGESPETVFAEFDPVPLASASLAQVHAARTHDGQKVAVKVQHDHLADTGVVDIATVELLVNVLHYIFPSFDYRWLVDEVRESAPKELDFLNEAKNSEKCLVNFRRLSPHIAGSIYAPKVYWTLSTSRILTMEFMDAKEITDVRGIKETGMHPADVSNLVSKAFAEMIFKHGFVHCDPHAANMMRSRAPEPCGDGQATAALSLGAGAGAVSIASSEDPAATLKVCAHLPPRLLRDSVTAATIAADYSWSLWGLERGTPAYLAAKHDAHLRSANRLQELCFRNGGIYIKLGQHIAQLEYVVPEEYVQTMRESMLKRCPVSSIEQVRGVFAKDLGESPETVFAEFDPVPLASASLAQVHAARTHDGQKVAVKVQHDHLADTGVVDIATVDLLVNVLHYIFPSFDYRWLVDEVRESAPKELDFLNEAKNSEKCLVNFRRLSPHIAGCIYAPKVYWTLSTSRILTMEFMDAKEITDVRGIKETGMHPADVSNLALVFADEKAIKENSVKLGAGEDLHALFAGVLTMRPWKRVIDPSLDHLVLDGKNTDTSELQEVVA